RQARALLKSHVRVTERIGVTERIDLLIADVAPLALAGVRLGPGAVEEREDGGVAVLVAVVPVVAVLPAEPLDDVGRDRLVPHGQPSGRRLRSHGSTAASRASRTPV